MKLKVLAWLLLSDGLNTKDMLGCRHYVVGPGSQRSDCCALCLTQSNETVENLIFSCTFARE
uniref:Reverse transcriptase zinc-binding domain-containing protein n=1 Tax=Aegilops tauschii subsp. strangulata TaxID=200361 RepID=A0A452ZZK9_AEGTS